MSSVPHLESVLTGRYVGFLANLLNSEKPELGIIFSSCYSNLATKTGQNISFLLHKHNKKNLKELINDKDILKKAIVNPTEENEVWKVNLIKEIVMTRKEFVDLEFDENLLHKILDDVCTI